MLQAWTPNTLPLPYAGQVKHDVPATAQSLPESRPAPVRAPVVLPPMVEINDNFPKGRIARYFPHQRYGFITDRNGRDVYFNLNEMDFVGPKDKKDIQVGLPVGYDVSHTSHGLHVKKLKIY